MGRDMWGDPVEDFMDAHRFHRPPPPRPAPSIDQKEACRCLGIALEDLKGMDRNALVRRYRRRAKETHPDAGGEEGAFLRVQEAFERLLEVLKE